MRILREALQLSLLQQQEQAEREGGGVMEVRSPVVDAPFRLALCNLAAVLAPSNRRQ